MRDARLLFFLLVAACGDEETPSDAVRSKPAPEVAPKPASRAKRVKWDHILISFKGAQAHKNVRAFRSREEAQALAYSVLDRLQSGVSFGLLKNEFSDDRDRQTGAALGPYVMVDGVKHVGHEVPRANYHPPLGNAVFGLKVGAVGVVDYDKQRCPLGWHVVKVLERE